MSQTAKKPSAHVAAKQAAKRKHIVQTAMELVAEEGLTALTIPRLSKRLEWTVGALYRYYPGKDGVITAMQLEAIDVFGTAMKKSWRSAEVFAGDQPGAKLAPIIALARTYMRLASERAAEFHLLNQILAAPETMLPEEDAPQVITPLLGVLMDIVTPIFKAQATGAISPGNGLYRLLGYWMSAVGLLQLRKIERHNPAVDFHHAILDTVVVHLKGWGATDEAVEAGMALAEAWDNETTH